ncbi:hypothetical protein JX188_002225 [Enterococcus faecalis]|nr:hypothetical protein [Enterococcus faecalis]
MGNCNLVAFFCEGNSEKYIMELLLQKYLLKYTHSDLVGEKLFDRKKSSMETFTNQFLTMDYEGKKIDVYGIQDSEKSFQFKYPYNDKIEVNTIVITAPEIEMLMIHSLNLYKDYCKVKSRKKPSEFVADKLKLKKSKIKSKSFILDFYEQHDLVMAIKTHKEKAPKLSKGLYLTDILK